MLNSRAKRKPEGFTLIELMVGLAVGLILTTAMIALVISVLRSNADAVASAKLTQEGRAIGDVIQRELKRARYSGTYLGFVGQGGSPANAFGPITISTNAVTGDCIKFSYDVDDDGALDANEVKSLFLDTGAVYFAQGPTYAAVTCTNTTAALRLSSPDVLVNTLAFAQRADDPATTTVNEANKNEVVVDYAIELTRRAGDDTGVNREFGQTIQLRNPFLN